MKIVCIGDSLTFGYGVNKNNNWVSLLSASSMHDILNKGINGDTSIGLLSRFFKDVIKLTPDICIIMCGSNDLLTGKSLDSIIDNILIMLKDCLANDIKPLVMSPPKVYSELASVLWSNDINYDITNANLGELNDRLLMICNNQDINFISLYDVIPQDKSYYTDGLHLSEKSNEYISKVLKERLAF